VSDAACVDPDDPCLVESSEAACAEAVEFVALAVGDDSNCALDRAGNAWCWGLLRNGNIGLGRDAEIRVPTAVPGLTKMVALDTSSTHTCGVTGEGRVRCQGSSTPLPGHGVGFAAGPSSTELPEISDAAAVAVGRNHTCVLGREGRVTCFGPPDLAMPAAGRALDHAVAVSGRGRYACAITELGEVVCWGEQFRRDLGFDATATELVKLDLPAAARALAVGYFHGCVVLVDGRVMCWGSTFGGALGDSGASIAEDFSPPVFAFGVEDAVDIAVGSDHSCALMGDGTVRCWGWTFGGLLGDGVTESSYVPLVVPGLKGVRALSAGDSHTCVLRTGAGGANERVCWGRNDVGQIGNGEDVDAWRPVHVSEGGAVGVAAGRAHTCTVEAAGETTCFGNNERKQVSTSGRQTVQRPVVYPEAGWTFQAVAATDLATVGLTRAGQVVVWGAGNEQVLDLGFGMPVYVPDPEPEVLPLEGVVAVAGGGDHACALSGDGSVSCWGAGESGQLGHVPGATLLTPGLVEGIAGARAIAAGGRHTCAVVGGEVACWGDNTFGQCGELGEVTPRVVAGVSGAVAVAAGRAHTCALVDDGRVWCWGDGRYGALGDGRFAGLMTAPVRVQGLRDVVDVKAGRDRTCALRADGAIACWGAADRGALGAGRDQHAGVPVYVSGVDDATALTLSVDGDHACAVRSGGALVCWGAGESGQLGDGRPLYEVR
jgi:alpha-tubulin suppressor-like RCC1 family protein